MEIVFFIIWGVCTLSCVLIFPIDNRIGRLSDDNKLKKWWMKHIISNGPNEKDSI
jgi:hypothetical protein